MREISVMERLAVLAGLAHKHEKMLREYEHCARELSIAMELLSMVLPENMGDTPKECWPEGGWRRWAWDVNSLLRRNRYGEEDAE